MRVIALDQLDLPSASPFLELPFPPPCWLASFVRLEAYQPIDTVFRREAAKQLSLMFRNTPDQVVSHPNIQGSVRLAGQQINIEHRAGFMVGPGFRRDCGGVIKREGMRASDIAPVADWHNDDP